MINTFTREKKEHFLYLLAETGRVTTSARRAGLSKQLAYHHRKSDPEFAAEWDAAMADHKSGLWQRRPHRTIITEAVRATRSLFMIACEDALRESGMNREEAAGHLSSLLSDVWNQLEREARRLPAPGD